MDQELEKFIIGQNVILAKGIGEHAEVLNRMAIERQTVLIGEIERARRDIQMMVVVCFVGIMIAIAFTSIIIVRSL